MTRNKPRKSATRLVTKAAEFQEVAIDDPKKLPEHYIVVDDNWLSRWEYWDGKLRPRGVKIHQPLTLYKLTRAVGQKLELCLECDTLEAPAPEGVQTSRGSYRNPDKAQRQLVKKLVRQEPA